MATRAVRVVWSPLSLELVEEIARVIATDRPVTARRWVVAVFDRVARLRQFPGLGRMVPELARPEIRELPYPPYRIIYRVDPKRVMILTVRHGRQELDVNEAAGTHAP